MLIQIPPYVKQNKCDLLNMKICVHLVPIETRTILYFFIEKKIIYEPPIQVMESATMQPHPS